MAYQETAISSLDTLIDNISAFAVSTGFTENYRGNDLSGRYGVTISGGGLTDFASFSESAAGSSDLNCMRFYNYDSDDPFYGLNHSCRGTSNLLTTGPYLNAYMFGEANVANPYLHIVLEISAGVFRHFGIGELVKNGSWSGGAYNYGTFINQNVSYRDTISNAYHAVPFGATDSDNYGSSLRCPDLDIVGSGAIMNLDAEYAGTYAHCESNRSLRNARGDFLRSSTNVVYRGMGLGRFMSGFYDANPSYFDQITTLDPITVVGCQASGYLTILGHPDNIRKCRIAAYSPKEEFTIAGDTWKIFPLVRKGFTDTVESSEEVALAYKKVT